MKNSNWEIRSKLVVRTVIFQIQVQPIFLGFCHVNPRLFSFRLIFQTSKDPLWKIQGLYDGHQGMWFQNVWNLSKAFFVS